MRFKSAGIQRKEAGDFHAGDRVRAGSGFCSARKADGGLSYVAGSAQVIFDRA